MTEPELRDLLNAVANQVKTTAAVMGCESPLFVLVLFNDPKVAQYVSNCRRTDMIEAMRETAARLERKQDVTR